MHLDTAQLSQEITERALDRGLMEKVVTVLDLGGEEKFMAFHGIVVDENETICAVVSARKHSPFCKLIHWTRIKELDVMWKV